ncbi:MAG: aggregation-promoting factor C-terminal-like domain-containing protein [Nocardioides sp.]
MPRRDEYVPKHRGPAAEPALKKGIKKSVLFSGVAVAATGLAVSSGVVLQQDAVGDNASASLSAGRPDPTTADLSEREKSVSRSDRRTSLDEAKKDALSQDSGGQETKTEDLSSAQPRDVARAMLADFGFTSAEFSCLDALYMSESGWDPTADNPISSAYGIPQALTGGTHDDLPADYMTNPVSQIRWGLQYIKSSYGTPCSAWEFKQANNWY